MDQLGKERKKGKGEGGGTEGDWGLMSLQAHYIKKKGSMDEVIAHYERKKKGN